MTITAGEELVDSAYYATHGPPHDIWTRLRAESPVHRCEPEGFQPFWAITRWARSVLRSRLPPIADERHTPFCAHPTDTATPHR
jgi:hypothetical protein